MHAILIPLGSHGDVHPFAGLALALRRRGHEVTFLTSPAFEGLASRLDVEFVGLGDADEFHEALGHPDLWEPRRAFSRVADLMLGFLRPVFDAVLSRSRPGRTVVAASAFAFGARVAREVRAIPLATVHLQPFLLRSLHLPPIVAGPPPSLFESRRGVRLVYWIADRFVLDRAIAPTINRFRHEHGLRPRHRLMRDWIHSPDLVLGLFPDWFGPIQPDWPPNTRVTAFPLYDEGDAFGLDPDVSAFLDDGPPPVAFTAGTAMQHGAPFFAESAAACESLGARGLLLARHAAQVVPDLPRGVRHVAYAPFSRLLPRCRAIAHHGGIGTSAQALAAGLPQLVVPLAHDQHDNAARLGRLGVGRTLAPKEYRAGAVADLLSGPLDTPEVASACRDLAGRVRAVAEPLADACDALEGLARRGPTGGPG